MTENIWKLLFVFKPVWVAKKNGCPSVCHELALLNMTLKEMIRSGPAVLDSVVDFKE